MTFNCKARAARRTRTRDLGAERAEKSARESIPSAVAE